MRRQRRIASPHPMNAGLASLHPLILASTRSPTRGPPPPLRGEGVARAPTSPKRRRGLTRTYFVFVVVPSGVVTE